jgi:hypothetical protein
MRLAHSLPSESPLSKDWPPSQHKFMRETNALLRKLYHKWRVSNKQGDQMLLRKIARNFAKPVFCLNELSTLGYLSIFEVIFSV